MTGRCAKCFAVLEPQAKFCQRCGTAVPAAAQSNVSGPNTCPSCKQVNDPSATFCESCGTQLSRAGRAPGGYQSAEPGQPSQGPGQEGAGYQQQQPAGLPRYRAEDPWATGGGPEDLCPRCGTYRPFNAAQCANCGLPFTQAGTDGIPYAVAAQGAPAGFWIRFAATIIDGVIIGIVYFVIFMIWLFSGDNLPADGEAIVQPAWLDWTGSLISFAYSVVFLANWGATPGKRLLNIYVLNAEGRRKIGYWRAIGRTLATILSTVLLFIGYIMVAFRRDKRALHDLIAGTYPTIIIRR